jgi:putative addiction module component (TIGR02574 family)
MEGKRLRTSQAQCGRAAGIRAKLNELDSETWFDNGELSEQEKAIIEARLDEYDRNPEAVSSWEEAKARILAGLHAE